MIALLRGTLYTKERSSLILVVGGIGYRISVPQKVIEVAHDGKQLELHIYHYISEGTEELYGFRTQEEREFFQLLLGVSGVGPKVALNILSQTRLEDLKEDMIRGETALLRDVSGVGEKLASRIVIELKNKVWIEGVHEHHALQRHGSQEVMDALLHLGYRRREIQEIVSSLPKDLTTLEEKVKEALRRLGR